MNLKILAFPIVLIILVTATLFAPFNDASANVDKIFSEPIDLGSPIKSVAIYDSTYGKENDRDVMYTTASGEPAIFQVVDLKSKEIIRTYKLEGSSSSWTHLTVPNGNVYIGGNGILYEYSPQTHELKDLGGIGESVIYGLSHDEEGRVYFGTFPNAKAGRYDPQTGEMHDYGNVSPGQSYSRSTAYHNGYLYLGIGIQGSLVKLDVETGEYQTIDLPTDKVEGSSNVWQLDAAGKYIVAGIGGGNNALLFYNTDTDQWEDKYYVNNKGLRLIDGLPGSNKAYFLQQNRLKEIDLDSLDAVDTGVTFGTYLRNTAWVEVEDDENLPGYSLVTVQFGGQVTYMNLETKTVKTELYPIVGNPIPIQTIATGPDGNIFVSGYPGGKAATVNPQTGESLDFSLGQAEGMASIGNKMYFGVYSGAEIFEMDVTQPISTGNPKKIYKIPHQDRPFVIEPINDKLYIGTIPDYGELGGSLTILDPEKVEGTEVFDNFIHNQSIAGLAESGGKLYGSTTIFGGLGIPPTESAAKLFVWDIESKEMIREFVPEIPGITHQPRMISGLSIGADGLLWAAADGVIFAMDPETMEIIKSKNVYPEIKNYGMWRPIYSYWSNGLLFTTLAGKLTVIDPQTMEANALASTELMTLGKNGDIFYTSRSNIMKIEVSDSATPEAVIELIRQHTEDGAIHPELSKKLVTSLNQAIHHREMGRSEQANKHIQDAIKHLQKAKPSSIDPETSLLIKQKLTALIHE